MITNISKRRGFGMGLTGKFFFRYQMTGRAGMYKIPKIWVLCKGRAEGKNDDVKKSPLFTIVKVKGIED